MVAKRLLPLFWLLHSLPYTSMGDQTSASQENGQLADDDLPSTLLSELAELERSQLFRLRVIVLTMNRPESLARLLNSLPNTFFEHPTDTLHVEIHVDKAHGTVWLRFTAKDHESRLCCLPLRRLIHS